MSEVQIFNNPIFGKLPIIEINGKDYFGASDAAKSLSFANPRDAINTYVDEDGVVVHDVIDNLGRKQAKKFVSEAGLYALIFGAARQGNNAEIKALAKQFQKWVFEEVLPSIRKTGGYQMKQPEYRLPSSFSEMTMVTQNLVGEQAERVKKVEDKVEYLEKDMPLPAGQYNKVGSMVSNAIHEYMKLHGLPGTANGKLRKDISNQINALAGIRTRTQLRIKDFEPVCQLIENWVPSTATRMQLQTELSMGEM